jgi:hypothetical protein
VQSNNNKNNNSSSNNNTLDVGVITTAAAMGCFIRRVDSTRFAQSLHQLYMFYTFAASTLHRSNFQLVPLSLIITPSFT